MQETDIYTDKNHNVRLHLDTAKSITRQHNLINKTEYKMVYGKFCYLPQQNVIYLSAFSLG